MTTPRARRSDAATAEVIVPWEPNHAAAHETVALNFHERTSGVVCTSRRTSCRRLDRHRRARGPEAGAAGVAPAGRAEPLRVLNEIRFAPALAVDVRKHESRGLRIESVQAVPVVDDQVEVTIAIALEQGRTCLPASGSPGGPRPT